MFLKYLCSIYIYHKAVSMSRGTIRREKKFCEKTITLYSITNYAYKECDGETCHNCQHDKMRKVFNLNKAIEMLKEPNYYINIKVESKHVYKIFGDVDHCSLKIEEVTNLIYNYCQYLKIPITRISITQNNKYKKDNSYHYVIPEYKCHIEDNKRFVEHLLTFSKSKYPEVEKWIDTSVYNCGTKGHFFRMPNQYKGQRFKMKAEQNVHEIKEGKMEDFLLEYIDESVKEFKCPDEWKEDRKEKVNKHVSINTTNVNIIKVQLFDKQVKYIEGLLNTLTVECITSYGNWIKIMMFLRKYNLRELAHKISKQCSNYDSTEIDRFFNRPNEKDCIGIGTIEFIAKQCNKEGYDKYIEKYGRLPIYANTDEIFLAQNKHDYDYTENTTRISDEAYKFLFESKSKGVILQTGTGVGKTYVTNKFRKEYPECAFLSISANRALACNHKAQMEGIVCYLDTDIDNVQQYIISFEQLHTINANSKTEDNVKYEHIVIDEFTSVNDKMYSPTVKNPCEEFTKLANICEQAKKIIVCDATITDSTLLLMDALTKGDYLYYRNFHQQSNEKKIYFQEPKEIEKKIKKENEERIIRMCDNKKDEKKMISPKQVDSVVTFIGQMKESIIGGKSCMIMSDSKKICDYVYKYVHDKLEMDKKNILIFTRDKGTLEDLVNCNETFLNKVVICSPKVIFGTDITIHYDAGCVRSIYTGGSVSGRQFYQQINRTRNSTDVHVLSLINDKHKHEYITYEQHKENELNDIKLYLRGLAQLNTKTKMIANLVTIRDGLKPDINEKDIIMQMHLLNSWYEKIFNCNKSQLFLSLCKEQGYDIEYSELVVNEIAEFTTKEVNDEVKEEIIQENKDYVEGKPMSDIINEKMGSRMAYLGITKEALQENTEEMKILREIIYDDDVMKRCVKSKILYESKEKINERIMSKYKDRETIDEWAFVNKEIFNPTSILTLEKVENIAGIERFDIDNVKYDETTKDKLKEISEELGYTLYGKISKKRNDTRMNKKFEMICDINGIKDVLCDLYNKYDHIVIKESIVAKYDGKMTRQPKYSINKDILMRHKMFIEMIKTKKNPKENKFDNVCIE